MDIKTALVHGGIEPDKFFGAVNVPIYQVSTFKQKEVGKHCGYEYARTGNPTREALEVLISELEGGKAGFAFASGMAAISAVLMLYGRGDHIIVSENVYGGTFRVMDRVFKGFGMDFSMVNTSELENVENAIRDNTKAIFVETPTNPLMNITDIRGAANLAGQNGVHLIVDNTFMTPYFQKPILCGADIVIHSATKYLGGHSDLIAGLVVVGDTGLAEKMYFIQNSTGGILGPQDSWLLMRGMRTLALRMERHQENAMKIARWLKEHPRVSGVYYPGLAEHPGHAVMKKQCTGFGGMISFETRDSETVRKLANRLEIITLAESLGGVESLLSVPSLMTHASVPPEMRSRLGISDRLVRLSVGIEDVGDIIDDLDRALNF